MRQPVALTRTASRLILLAAVAALGVSGIGCAGGASAKKTHRTQQQVAEQNWKAARAGVLFSLAQSQYQTGNFDKSRQTVDQALTLDPSNAALHILSAKLSIERGRFEAAQTSLAAARGIPDLAPHLSAEADYLLGVVHERWKRPEVAHALYLSAMTRRPGELAYLMATAEMLVTLDREDEALRMLEGRVVFFEHSAALRAAVGQLLMQTHRPADAAAYFRSAMHLEDDALTRTQHEEHLALALFAAGQHRLAAGALESLVARPAFARRADLHLALGECRMRLHRYADARDAFHVATTLEPAEPDAWLSLAKATLELNDLRRAELCLRKARQLSPHAPGVRLLTGYLRLRQERLGEALLAFREASELDPTDPVALCMVGFVLQRTGQPDRAIVYYGRALNLSPSDELATHLMASIDTSDVLP